MLVPPSRRRALRAPPRAASRGAATARPARRPRRRPPRRAPGTRSGPARPAHARARPARPRARARPARPRAPSRTVRPTGPYRAYFSWNGYGVVRPSDGGKLADLTAFSTHDPVGVPANLPETVADVTRPLLPMTTLTIAMPGTLNWL